MSLINRIALCNYSNAEGEDGKEWNPRFRYEILDFGGQSAVVNLINGGGKTTIANAVIGLLSRQPTLLKRAKEHAARQKEGYWSHIQVELIEPLNSAMNNDMFTDAGGQVSGETWVFGMTMNLDADGNDYYYYPGRLENLAPGFRQQGLLKITQNADFREMAKKIKGIEWGVPLQNWRARISQHIPIETLLGMAEFQIKGGSDKDAPIFKLAQLKKGMRLDQIFFYEILAPELLHDVLDDNEGENSSSIDQALFRIIRNVVNTRHRLSAHKNKVNEMALVMERLREAAELGKTALQASKAYDISRNERALDLMVLDQLVSKQPIPGVPLLPLPMDKCGEIAAHLVVIPGESAPRITNYGLAAILHEDVRLVKQKAERMHIFAPKPTQLIDIPCDLKIKKVPIHGGGRYQPIAYTVKQSTDLLSKYADKNEIALFEDAVSWFENTSDTNPFRHALMEAEVDESEAISLVNKQRKKIEQLQEQSIHLATTQKQVLADQAALNELKQSELFTEGELLNISATAKLVLEVQEATNKAFATFQQDYARLEDYIEDWQSYRKKFSDDAPSLIHERLSINEESARKAVKQNQDSITKTEVKLSNYQQKINSLDNRVLLDERSLKSLETLQINAHPVLDTLKDGESPIGLEVRRRDAQTKAQEAFSDCQLVLRKVEAGIKTIAAFHSIEPNINPHTWITEINQERTTLTVNHNNLSAKYEDLMRQRKALNIDPVAANEVAQKIFDHLDENSISYVTLHNFILTLKLSEQRQRNLLGMFSALLFVPVINKSDEALRATELIAQAELPVPVFLAEPLTNFCTDCSISELANSTRLGLIAGKITRQVECILDPKLVDREKTSLDKRIEQIEGKRSTIADRLYTINPEGELVQKARAAAAAITEGYPEQLESLQKQHIELDNAVQCCNELLTDKMLTALRSAEEYYKKGGDNCMSQTINTLKQNRMDIDTAQAQSLMHNNELKNFRTQVASLNEDVTLAYPAEIKSIVQRAERFIKLDGPSFLESQGVISKKLEEDKLKASARAEYKLHFPRAEKWLDYQRKLETDDNLDNQIIRNQADIKLAKEHRVKAEDTIKSLKPQLLSLRGRVEAIDLAAIALLNKYKRAMLMGSDFHNFNIQEIDIDNHPIGVAAWQLQNVLKIEDTNVIEVAESFTTIVDEFDIDAELDAVKQLFQKRENAIKFFIDKTLEASLAEKGLVKVERDRLQEVTGVDAAEWVEQFANDYWKLYTREEDELSQLSIDEKTVNAKFTERLALLMEAASDNLIALRTVASKNPEGIISHFEVTATVAKQDEMAAIIDRIVDLVSIHETRRREDEEHNRRAIKGDKVLATLQADIRETLYRSVFSNVSVKFANQQIRADGKTHRLSASLSTGQKNALLMMWVLRLAQYRIEREARKRITSLSRRRVRNNAQSIMIIDGLFSNLSEPKLINSVMSSLTGTRGHFQLIGLVHDPKYQHNFDLFPRFLLGKSQDDQSWLTFDNLDESGALAFAKLIKTPSNVTP